VHKHKHKQQANRVANGSKTAVRPKRDETTEYRARYRPIVGQNKPKAFEAEQADERVKVLVKMIFRQSVLGTFRNEKKSSKLNVLIQMMKVLVEMLI
jgi:hypothetical protein